MQEKEQKKMQGFTGDQLKGIRLATFNEFGQPMTQREFSKLCGIPLRTYVYAEQKKTEFVSKKIAITIGNLSGRATPKALEKSGYDIDEMKELIRTQKILIDLLMRENQSLRNEKIEGKRKKA